ncbi:hypothetical protein KDL01_12415 [Actinospica durhamensis]|uniref:ABC transporter permease n=1 Tax=Actinospica durhamensis TaxID=1508375 RepID=A0A941INK6_9ACTN|nr:hypothetical protein [Actinospica durhamensis]MBR7834074.1 hypothetical protein [Actinospica durhamensis]
MSATTADAELPDEAWPEEAAAEDVPGWRDVLRAENAKLRSIFRLVTLPALGVIVVLLVGISSANQQQRFVVSVPAHIPAAQAAQIRALQLSNAPDPLGIIFGGVVLAAVLFGCFGAYCACVEYSNGMIRSTLTAVPRRGRLFGAKLTAAMLAAAPAALASILVVFWIGDALLARHLGISVGAFEGRVLLRLFGAVVCLLGATALGFAIGMIMRSTAASIVALVFVYLFLIALLGAAVSHSVQEYLAPSLLGELLYLRDGGSGQPPLAAAYPLYLAWPLVFSAAAYLRFTRSDAG